MSIKQKTLSGLAWSIFGRFGQQAAQFIISVYLARLLMPEDFGTIVMVIVITEFAMIFLEHGFPAALIQRQKLTNQHIFSIFWLNIVVALTLATILFFSAPLIALLYKTPDLTVYAQVMAVGFFISSLVTIPRALMQKKLWFKKIAIADASSVIGSGAVAIALAANGFGIWSLVVQFIFLGFIRSVAMWIAAKWLPRFVFDFKAIKELFKYSINHLGTIIIYYWADNGEKMLIGRFLGSASLGIYNRSINQVRLATSQIDTILYQVMFPVFSSIQDNTEKIKQIFLDALGAICLIISPIMFGLFVTADSFILTVYGEKWSEVIPILRILCGVGLMVSIIAPTKWIYMAKGKTDWMFRWELVSSGTLILFKCVGAFLGTIKAVAICFTIGQTLLVVPGVIIAGKLIDMKLREVAKSIIGPMLCGLLMGSFLIIIRAFFPFSWGNGLRLIINIVLGVIIYFSLIHFSKVKAYLQIREIIIDKLKGYFGIRSIYDSNSGFDESNPNNDHQDLS